MNVEDQPRIANGDCLELLPQHAGVDLIIADPPYNIGVDYGDGARADRLPPASYGIWCADWIRLCAEALRPGGSLWVISGQEHGAKIDTAIEWAGLVMRNRITWHESFGVYCHRKFGRTSRPIYYAVKPGAPFTFNADAVRIPSDRQAKYGDRRANPAGKIMGDVWQFSRVCGTFRERVNGVPTQLPEALVRRIVEVSSRPGDVVLDPFAGSGTVPAVAMKLGRVGAGIEKNPEYAAIATNRLLAACFPINGDQ